MEAQKTVAFHTLGCKLNFAETSAIAKQFEQQNFIKTDFEDGADVFVINTCSVTEDANRECRRIVRNALRSSPNASVIVTGCYAQLKPEEIAHIKGVDLVLGANEKFNALKHLAAITEKKKNGAQITRAEIHSCEIDAVNSFIDAFSSGDRTRSFLKVQDGCDYTCSYCTIPLARGASRSDTLENVVSNAVKIAEQGIREIVLTGVNVGDFSAAGSTGKRNFLDLIRSLDNLPVEQNKHPRFRISSIEPNLLNNDIIEFASKSKNFVPHFHIPLQSGSDKILGLMRRRYQRALYADRIQHIKSLMPHCSIGVDVIVGFPGEGEKEFTETFDFIHGLDVSYLHVFTYSERDNTEALKLTEVVPIEERRRRNKVLRNLSAKKQRLFYEQQTGKELSVLFESENKNGFMFGFTENYLKVKAKFNSDLVNTISKIHINRIDSEGHATAGAESRSTTLAHIN